jgi:hypothetical protein
VAITAGAHATALVRVLDSPGASSIKQSYQGLVLAFLYSFIFLGADAIQQKPLKYAPGFTGFKVKDLQNKINLHFKQLL